MVLTTDWGHAVWDAFGSCHVVPKDAHTLAQDVVIGLQIGAVYLSWVGTLRLRKVGIGEGILYLGDFGSRSLTSAECVGPLLTVGTEGKVAGGERHCQQH